MNVLVTGGAGYIGSHIVRQLVERGDTPTIVDDLSLGVAERNPGVPIELIDLVADTAADRLTDVMRTRKIDSIIHFAALKAVGESVEQPARYYRHNLGSLANVLAAAARADIRRIVFSSSAAVYAPADRPLSETDPTAPISPYGETKLAGEWLTAAAAAAHDMTAVSLRYFNVAGAAAPELGDTAIQNLIPMVLEKLRASEAPIIFGDDYPTPDGTCIRDYIHVQDVAEAHLAALDTLERLGPGHHLYNIGTGHGTSVRDIVDAVLAETGSDIRPRIVDRRAGDPAIVVAAVDRIRDELGWSATLGLHDIVHSAVEAHHHKPATQEHTRK